MIPQGMSIQQAYRFYRDGDLIVNRKYQRKLVWAEDEKIYLIDTILKNFPIPLILLAKRTSIQGRDRYEILDGVQRLNAIFSFIENQFLYNEKYFDINEFARAKQFAEQGAFLPSITGGEALSREQCASFLDYQLAVTIFSAYDDDQVTEIFGRINSSGRQLSDQERRQAGVVDTFGELVRNISAEIRGDASKEILNLYEMPEISIETSRSRQNYGLTADSIFWCRQGILAARQLRSSEDEEMIADITASILLGKPFSRTKENLDNLYIKENETKRRIESALISYTPDRLAEEIKQTFSVLRETIEEYNDNPNTLRNIVNPKIRNPIKTSFYSIFMAFFDLLVKRGLSPYDPTGIMESLKGLQKDMKTYKYVRPEDRQKNIDIVIGLIQRYFVHKEPPVLSHGPGLALEFENSLRRSRIETPRYEFKQGILDLDEKRKINNNLLYRLVEIACGMANIGPNSEGYIYLGVADKKKDADRIKQLDGVDCIDISGHYVVGIERECTLLKWDIEQYVDKIVGSIRSSRLSDPLRTQILTQIDIINYKGYTAIRIKIPAQSAISFVGDVAFVREGNETIEIKGPKLVAISGIFK